VKDFSHHDIGRVRLPPTEVHNVYNHTTVINNTTVVNNTIVNRGVPVERVAAVTHTTIKPAAIREAPAGGRFAASRTIEHGPTPVVYRHDLTGPAKPLRVEAQKVDDRHPIVQHPAIVPNRTDNRPQSGRGAWTAAPAATVPHGSQS